MTTPGATEAVTPDFVTEHGYTAEQYAAAKQIEVRIFGWYEWQDQGDRAASMVVQIMGAIREAEANALRRALRLCDISISYFRDGAAMSARVPKGERDCAAVALDDLKKAIRSLLPKEEGK